MPDTTLTKPQVQYLTKLMRHPAGLRPYGGEYASLRALAALGLVNDEADLPVRVTVEGLKALRDYRLRRWGKDGCMAYLGDLNEVEAALKQVSA